MGFSPLADMSRRIPERGRSSARGTAITGAGIHHNAGVDSYGEASNPSRQVSANYWITNAGDILPNVDENRRAWTSGHASYPAGAQADRRNITIEVSNTPEGVRNKTWEISDAAMNALINLLADLAKRHKDFKLVRSSSRGVGVHSDWVATACPGPYIMKNLGHIISSAQKVRDGDDSIPAPSPSPAPAPQPSSSKTVAQMADEVIAGKHGTGHDARRRSLGVSATVYEQVRAEVNRRVYGGGSSSSGSSGGSSGSTSSSIARMASEVIDGKHGNGHANRRKSLGVSQGVYDQVRAEVNRRLGLSTSSSSSSGGSSKSISQMATEVIAGKHGNGHANRRRSLGVSQSVYDRVRAEVNRRV